MNTTRSGQSIDRKVVEKMVTKKNAAGFNTAAFVFENW